MPGFDHALSVLGAGSYGTALAISCASKGLKVMLWGHRPEHIEAMRRQRCNERYLPGVPFPGTLGLTASLKEAVGASDTLLIVVPSANFHETLCKLSPFLTRGHSIAWATKGLEYGTGRLLSTLAAETLPFPLPLAAISGPTFAGELACGLPTAIAVAATEPGLAGRIAELMHTPTFRIYESSDIISLQLGGAVKNVIAIGAGLSDGLGYGANARTALITRGLVEMIRLGVAMGGSDHGFMGLSGLGDLMLTCTDDHSRNRRFGYMLGQGIPVPEALAAIGQVVEGHVMSGVVAQLARKLGVQMPICDEIDAVVNQGKDGHEAARALLTRALKSE
ncbi:MAG: NAD(P)-dependent glycerol-3-phosphate dehydrogenase [Succinivibrionaceae bacterium]|nr:NAD(P)-dependent glycerol-3-phosphate dehydrogenase [Succinivibrionaceae bacterium]